MNGVATRHCWLQAGDQVVFDGGHRFVLEMPRNAAAAPLLVPDEPVVVEQADKAPASVRKRSHRWPWLLLSALLLGAAISALLLFGAR